MSTTPPEQPPEETTAGTRATGAAATGTGGAGYGPGGMGSVFGSMPTDARLPIPGNAELALYLVALALAAIVCWIADDLGAASWLSFFQWTTIAYLLSRGIAKASRVLEQ